MSYQSKLRISDLPDIRKPREKLLAMGATNLTNQELVAILLRSGTRHNSALSLAKKLTAQGLQSLSQFSWTKLCSLEGIGPAKASTLMACFEIAKRCNQELELVSLNNPNKVFAQAYEIKDKKQEICLALYLDGSQRLLKKITLAIGSFNQNFLEFRALLKPAFNLPAAGIILVHNHPSGNVQPSEQDLSVTKQVMQGLNLVGVDLIDHVIVASDKYFSLKQAGLIE